MCNSTALRSVAIQNESENIMAERMLRTVFDWEHFAVYLSGAMDFADDGGKGWREDWTNRLVQIGMNPQQIYNPCKKPFHSSQFNIDDEHALGEECRATGDWERYYDIMGQIIHIDLRLVEKSDLILVNMPKIGRDNDLIEGALKNCPDESSVHGEAVHKLAHAYAESRVPTYGTIHEIALASLLRKPIFMVWEGNGLQGCSAWLMRLVGYKNVFLHVEDMIQHLVAISQGKQAYNANKWLLLDPK
jgi:hypothetical protein